MDMDKRYPFSAYPDGWYVVATTSELADPKGVLRVPFMGRDIVVFRTSDGAFHATEAYCPHLGAHFGHGGSVVDDTLRCPFHGFRFATDGHCVATGYGTKPPPSARLGVLPTAVRESLVLAYHSASGAAPSWQVPPSSLPNSWTPMSVQRWEVRSHPQETTENSVDLGHFEAVHGYSNIRITQPLQVDGPNLTIAYAAQRGVPPWGWPSMPITYDVDVWGLGYSVVTGTAPALGVSLRFWVLPTPTTDGRCTLRVAMRIRIDEAKQPRLLRGWPTQALQRLLHPLIWQAYRSDVSQDFDIWNTKAYIARPALAKGDGPIAAYRKWCRQFYPESQAPRAVRSA